MSFIGKFFVFLFGLAVLAVVGAWIMGGESVKHSTAISIDATPDSVFQYLTDAEKIKQWGSDIVSVGSFDGEDDSPKQQKRIVREDGAEVVWEDALIRFEAGDAISIQSRKGGLTYTYVYQLEENGIGGTDLRYRLARSASGLDQFLFAFQEDSSDSKMAAEMTRLKTLIESEVEFVPMFASDELIDDESLVDRSESDGNADAEGADGLADSDEESLAKEETLMERAIKAVSSSPEKKPQSISERNFESLFGTGRPR